MTHELRVKEREKRKPYIIKNHNHRLFERKFCCKSCKKDIKELYIAEKKKDCTDSEICMNCYDPEYKIYL